MTHMHSVGKCNGNETLEMLPHSTRKCKYRIERTQTVLVCVPPGFVGYMFEEFQLHFGISRPPHLSRLGGTKTTPKYLHMYEKTTHI